jgi:hypothetical protein
MKWGLEKDGVWVFCYGVEEWGLGILFFVGNGM